MRLKPGEIIANYPPKLRELAIKRAIEQNRTREEALIGSCWGQFTVMSTPEGGDFWAKVWEGKEIDDYWWEEEYSIY